MASKICRRCGSTTNTTLCDWLRSHDEKADKCYAKWNFETESWEPGCAYDNAPKFSRDFADKCINGDRKESK